jgi:hypothetical protein
MFEERALPVTEDVMFKWRLLVEDGRKAGHTYSQPDLIIAATALHHGLTVVSRDTSDFHQARVPVSIRGAIATPDKNRRRAAAGATSNRALFDAVSASRRIGPIRKRPVAHARATGQ